MSRHFSRGLSCSAGSLKSSSEGTFEGKLDGEALPAQALSQHRILLCVVFSCLGDFFFIPGYFHFEIAYQLLTLSKKPH